MLDKGEDIQSLLGDGCKEPIFLMNPLFLQFCLWFLQGDQTYFNFVNRHEVYQGLIQFSLGLINSPKLNIETYSAFDISSTDIGIDKLRVRFLTEIIVKCNKTSKLILPDYEDDDGNYSEALDKSLKLFNPILKAITCIEIGSTKYYVTSFKGSEMAIDGEDNTSDEVDIILKHYTSIMNMPAVHLDFDDDMYSTNNVSYNYGKLLYVKSLPSVDGSVENTINYSPQLKHLCFDLSWLRGYFDVMIRQLVDAAKIGNLLNLSRLSILNCDEMEGKVPLLFNSAWPNLKHLNLLGTQLSAADMEFLCLACNGPKKLLPNVTSLCITIHGEEKAKCWTKLFGLEWLNLRSFHVYTEYESGSCGLFDVIRDNKLTSLTSLIIETDEHTAIKSLCLDQLPNLQSLFFLNCHPRTEIQEGKNTPVLSEFLILSDCGLSGNLSSFICKKFQLMTTLILTNTDLEDLNILNRAKAKNMLPILKHLDMSGISKKLSLSELMSLFHGSCTWNGLLTLDIRWVFDSSEDDRVIDYLNEIVSRGYLPSLQKLGINRFDNKNVHWNHLETLMLYQCKDDELQNIAEAAFWEYLPALSTLCIEDFEGYNADIVHYLSHLGVSCHKRCIPLDNMYHSKINCLCET